MSFLSKAEVLSTIKVALGTMQGHVVTQCLVANIVSIVAQMQTCAPMAYPVPSGAASTQPLPIGSMGKEAPVGGQGELRSMYGADWSRVSEAEQVVAPKVLMGQTVISDYWCLQRSAVSLGDGKTLCAADAKHGCGKVCHEKRATTEKKADGEFMQAVLLEQLENSNSLP